MQGEIEERQEQRPKKRRKKKKSKFGYYLYAVVILLLTITNITLVILLLTHVQKIEVNGAVLSEEESIIAWVKEDPLTTNSLYTLWKYNLGSYETPIYLEDVKVTLGAPWIVKVDVTEKESIACFLKDETFVYFDEEGLVMEISKKLHEGTTLIEGIQVKKVNLFETLKVENEKIFSYIEEIVLEIEKNELTPDRLVWEEDSVNLYFSGVCVQLGKSNFDVKLEQLPTILPDLEGKEGVLHMEHYSEIGEKISFEMNEPIVAPEEDVDGAVSEETGETTE